MALSAALESALYSKMRGCILGSNGEVNYYLKSDDWSKKEDGTTADLTGNDGQVMVQIPKFWFKQTRWASVYRWQISSGPFSDFSLHPAFVKNGEVKDYRYISAYDVCVYDDSASDYLGGKNLDDNSGNVDLGADTLASVKDQYPMVGLTRDQFRQLAANIGTGWRLGDFWLVSAIQMLYLVEYQDFASQAQLGAGNTEGGYISSSADQNDSPHTIAGAGDSIADGSTDATSGAGVDAKPGTSFMKYRGIENFYGNCTNWVDGININDRQAYVSNDDSVFADDTDTDYEELGVPAPDINGQYVTDLQDVDGAFIPAAGGGSSTTYMGDAFYENTGWRVARFGGGASLGARAGAFCWYWFDSSSDAYRTVGARISF